MQPVVPEDAPIGRAELDSWLRHAAAAGASDVHLSVGVQPTLRVDGIISAIPETPELATRDTESLARSMMTPEQFEAFSRCFEIDFTYASDATLRFRVNAFREQGRIAVSMRTVPGQPPEIENLGLPAAVTGLAELHRGLVLVTGTTGSGKSTTLAALVNRINRDRCERVVTIEDPIEFVHRHNRSFIHQRELGHDTHSFADALHSVLREDPDVILIGEMRDHDTVATAVAAAETGHLVFATLHTITAAQTISRIIGMFPPREQQLIRMQVAGSLAAVVSQRLVPACAGGRTAVAEVLIADPAIRNLIREGKDHQIDNAMQSNVRDGTVLFDAHLAEKVRRGLISMSDAMIVAHEPDQFRFRMART